MKLRTAFLAAVALAAPAQAQRRSAPDLHRFLQGFFAADRTAARDARYVAALANLNTDRRPEVVVYLTGSYYCGSGGCALYVFTPSGRSWRPVARTRVTRTPIRVLNSRSRGWRDLSVTIAGGGLPRREVLLAFNGRRYPGNPTAPPARLLRQSPPGRLLIAETATGRRLFD